MSLHGANEVATREGGANRRGLSKEWSPKAERSLPKKAISGPVASTCDSPGGSSILKKAPGTISGLVLVI